MVKKEKANRVCLKLWKLISSGEKGLPSKFLREVLCHKFLYFGVSRGEVRNPTEKKVTFCFCFFLGSPTNFVCSR